MGRGIKYIRNDDFCNRERKRNEAFIHFVGYFFKNVENWFETYYKR